MARMRLDKLVRRWFPVVACAPLILLAGCPQENAAAPGKAPVQATAPTVHHRVLHLATRETNESADVILVELFVFNCPA